VADEGNRPTNDADREPRIRHQQEEIARLREELARTVVEAGDGRWAAFEIKLGGRLIEEGAANLRKFRNRIDTGKCRDPAALAVIVATGYAYQREDGVGVIPIGSLGP
jgi:hypothetical protein